jgi:hypothetical protein
MIAETLLALAVELGSKYSALDASSNDSGVEGADACQTGELNSVITYDGG